MLSGALSSPASVRGTDLRLENELAYLYSDGAATYNPMLPQIEKLNAELKTLADKYGVEIAQIPVAWAIAKGTLPIIGVTKVKHVEDAAKAAAITLTGDEIAHLEKVADTLGLNMIRFWENGKE